MIGVQFQSPVQRGHHSLEAADGGETLAVDANLLAETAEEGEMCVGELVVRGHRPFRKRLAPLKVGEAHRARFRRPAEVAFLLRRRAQLRGRVLRRRELRNDAQEGQRDAASQARNGAFEPDGRVADTGAKDRLRLRTHLAYSPTGVRGTRSQRPPVALRTLRRGGSSSRRRRTCRRSPERSYAVSLRVVAAVLRLAAALIHRFAVAHRPMHAIMALRAGVGNSPLVHGPIVLWYRSGETAPRT